MHIKIIFKKNVIYRDDVTHNITSILQVINIHEKWATVIASLKKKKRARPY